MSARAARAPVLRAHPGPPVRLELDLPADLDCFRGHFPGCPILAGVVQLDWAIRFGSEYLGTSTRVTRISALKFMRIVRPGARLALILEPTPDGMRFEYRHQRESTQAEVVCSSGRIACAR